MKRLYLICVFLTCLYEMSAQVKSNYLYNTSTPYGTLDIRTTISSTDYYYLQENRTFSYRESTPGVRTNTFLDMTSTWDSSPYRQGNLRRKTGTSDKYIMNYRLLFPANYTTTYAEGYPLIIMFHGAAERGNCYYNNCYHASWSWDPNTNYPKAPTSSTSKLLNNDHNLNIGGKTHLDARNLAGSKLPNDPTLAGRAFPGFVLVPQMLNIWDSLKVQDAIRLVQLVIKKYKVDPNRVYVHGLSIGGFAVWQAVKRAPWLFAAALPMSANHDANIIKQNQAPKVGHIPYWIFQGGKDTNPTPSYTNNLVNYLRNGGASVKYTVYADLGHTCWYKAMAEPEFFKFMLQKNKANIHVYKNNTVISGTRYPKLILPEGFFAYQWEKNGVITSTTSNTYTATTAGKYRARFSRVPNPTSTQWNKWSAYVTITTSTVSSARITSVDPEEISEEELSNDIVFEMEIFPNPTTGSEVNVRINTPERMVPVRIQLIDPLGKAISDIERMPDELTNGLSLQPQRFAVNGIYLVVARQGAMTIRKKILIGR